MNISGLAGVSPNEEYDTREDSPVHEHMHEVIPQTTGIQKKSIMYSKAAKSSTKSSGRRSVD